MRTMRIAAAVLALALGAQMLFAQQPKQGPGRPADSVVARSGMAQQQMRMMDSLNARLDTLVGRMNRATGNRKVAAMADVINELVAQRKAMHEHMREMMQSGRGMMMDMMGAPAPAEARPTAADSAAHKQHHPPI